ncbi:MAG: starch phosphorylase, partial [Halothiobacillaceae bacterium]
NRMVRDYVEQLYLPAAQRYAQRQTTGVELLAWEQALRSHWNQLHWGNVELQQQTVGWSIAVQVTLGAITPQCVRVQLYADGGNGLSAVCHDLTQSEAILGSVNGYLYRGQIDHQRPAQDFTLRIIPTHPQVAVPMECGLILWGPSVA